MHLKFIFVFVMYVHIFANYNLIKKKQTKRFLIFYNVKFDINSNFCI